MPTAGPTLFVTGRLSKLAPPEERRGHAVQARTGRLLLDSSVTDETGRFLLEWTDNGAKANMLIELLDPRGAASESVELTMADLDSPPVVVFSGEGVVGTGNSGKDADRGDRFEAEGCHPVCVASSCQEVTLSWTGPEGSRISILSGGRLLHDRPSSAGSLKVSDARSSTYTRRIWLAGAGPDQFSDRTVEVRRYPSLSLVVYGLTLRTHGQADLGASISPPAGDGGVIVGVRSSDPEMVPDFEIRIPPELSWATTLVSLGSKEGVVTLTASARGFARDAVTLSLKQS
jgi:hypothetical protein